MRFVIPGKKITQSAHRIRLVFPWDNVLRYTDNIDKMHCILKKTVAVGHRAEGTDHDFDGNQVVVPFTLLLEEHVEDEIENKTYYFDPSRNVLPDFFLCRYTRYSLPFDFELKKGRDLIICLAWRPVSTFSAYNIQVPLFANYMVDFQGAGVGEPVSEYKLYGYGQDWINSYSSYGYTDDNLPFLQEIVQGGPYPYRSIYGWGGHSPYPCAVINKIEAFY